MEDAKIITQNGIRKKVYNCFVDNGGKVYTWGDNNYGKLGNGTNENSYEPICISDIEESELKDRNIQEISIKEDTIIAKDETKEILVWGRFTENEDIKFPTPATISDTSKIVDICIDTYDYDNAILLDSNGKVYTYGDNDYGQLGDGTNNDSYYVPICISDIEGNELKGKKIDYIYIYRNSVIVKDEQGKLYTWGYNYGGRLGNGKEYEDSNIPVCISDINGNDLEDKCIEKIDIIEWNGAYAYIITVIDSEGNAYIWGTCSNISFSYPTCINGEENMALFNKTLKNYVTDGNGRVWITTEGKMYYSKYMVMV